MYSVYVQNESGEWLLRSTTASFEEASAVVREATESGAWQATDIYMKEQ